MKINFAPALIALALGALIAYAMYSLNDSESKLLLAIGSFIFVGSTLLTVFGISFEKGRTSANVRTVAGLFFATALTSNIIFAFINFAPAAYVITNGILFLLFILVSYFIVKAKQ